MHRIKNRCDYGQLTAAYGVGNQVESDYDGAFRLSALRRTNHRDGTNLSAWYAYDAFSRRIAKGVIENDKEKLTRYGWDGDKLVHEATKELLTTIVYALGSFAPLIRIDQNRQYMLKEEEQKSERERAMQEAMKQVEGLLAAEGIELKKPPPDPRWIDVSFFVTDHAGTPVGLVNENGRVIWQAEPDDWAAVRNEKTFFQGDIRQPIRFQGQWLDEESGFYYNRYRFYDPRHGRYVTQDPIGLTGGLNVYAYVQGNPISNTDPLGLYHVNPNGTLGEYSGGGGGGGEVLVIGGALLINSISNAVKSLCCGKDTNADNEEKCEKKRQFEEGLCEAIALQWGRQGIEICKRSAFTRYSECLRFGPSGVKTPLHGVDTPL